MAWHPQPVNQDYSSDFEMDNPPLLIAWIVVRFSESHEVEWADISNVMPRHGLTTQDSDHEVPEAIWENDEPHIVHTMKVWRTEDASRVVGLSRRELYVLGNVSVRFRTMLQTIQDIVQSLDLADSNKVMSVEIHYNNVFESEGLLTRMLRRDLQGPDPSSDDAHEHRYFYFSKLENLCWYQLAAEYAHGHEYKPRIRGGLETHLSLAPPFDPVRETHIYVFRVSAVWDLLLEPLDLERLIEGRRGINQLFLNSITDEARNAWQLHPRE